MYASVNSAGVVSQFGATQGLLTFDQIEEKLNQNPQYHYGSDSPGDASTAESKSL